MKRIASIFAAGVCAAGTFAGVSSAGGPNVAVQSASIKQAALANAPATQFAGGTLSVNINASNASAANYASITQWLTQFGP